MGGRGDSCMLCTITMMIARSLGQWPKQAVPLYLLAICGAVLACGLTAGIYPVLNDPSLAERNENRCVLAQFVIASALIVSAGSALYMCVRSRARETSPHTHQFYR